MGQENGVFAHNDDDFPWLSMYSRVVEVIG